MADKYGKTPKTEMDFAYDDARDAARAEVRKLVRRITDVIYLEIDKEFRRALLAGEEITVQPDIDEIKKAALPIIKKQLSA